METPVRRVQSYSDLQDSLNEYRAEPLVVVNAATAWPLLQPEAKGDIEDTGAGCSRSLKRLRAVAGDVTVEALQLAYDGQGVQSGHEREHMRLRELLFRAGSDEDCADRAWYLQWRDLPHPDGEEAAPAPEGSSSEGSTEDCAVADLMAQVRLPAVVDKAAIRQVNAWIGCSKTSHLHFDGCDNLLVVAHGSKDVLLFSPWQISDLYPQSGSHDERWKSAAVRALHAERRRGGRIVAPAPTPTPTRRSISRWLRALDPQRSALYVQPPPTGEAAAADAFPRLRAAPRLRATVRSGEALWIPTGWWHEVLTPRLCVAFNFWWRSTCAVARLRPTILHLASDEFAAKWSARVATGSDEPEPERQGQEVREESRHDMQACDKHGDKKDVKKEEGPEEQKGEHHVHGGGRGGGMEGGGARGTSCPTKRQRSA